VGFHWTGTPWLRVFPYRNGHFARPYKVVKLLLRKSSAGGTCSLRYLQSLRSLAVQEDHNDIARLLSDHSRHLDTLPKGSITLPVSTFSNSTTLLSSVTASADTAEEHSEPTNTSEPAKTTGMAKPGRGQNLRRRLKEWAQPSFKILHCYHLKIHPTTGTGSSTISHQMPSLPIRH
jgi:hypothetical protein